MTHCNGLLKLAMSVSGSVIGAMFGLALATSVAWSDLIGHGGMVHGVAISPDGGQVLTASFDYTARLWAFTTQTELGVLDAHTGPVNAAVFSPDGQTALTASDDGVVLAWDVHRQRVIQRLKGHQARVVDVAVSPDGRLAASAGWDTSARVWDLSNGKEIWRFGHDADPNAVVFSRQSTVIYCGLKDGAIAVWDVATGRRVHQFPAHDMAVTHLAVSPDGTLIASAGIDGTVRLWRASDYAEQHVLRTDTGPIHAAVFSPDGRRIASAGHDGRVMIWPLGDERLPRLIGTHEGPVWDVAWTPDGRFVLSSSSDESVRVWHVESGDRIGEARAHATGTEPWLTSKHPGAKIYRACAGCHGIDPEDSHRSGPHFAGIFGRRAGSLPDYNYSEALRRATFVWNAQTLQALFEKGPDSFLPGTKMPLQRIPSRADRDALVDYLYMITNEAHTNEH